MGLKVDILTLPEGLKGEKGDPGEPGSAGLPVGVSMSFWGASAPAGWLLEDGKTIGGASSGATARANADVEELFTLLWNGTDNTTFPIQNSSGTPTTRGASATADFAANKRFPLPDSRGRVKIGYGQGAGLTNRNILGEGIGEETHILTLAETPTHGGHTTGTALIASGTNTL